MWSIIHSGVAAMRAPGNASISMLNNLSVMVALLKKLPPIYWIVFLGIAGYLLPVIWGAPDDTNGTSVGRREGTVRLHAQFTGGCPAGWRSRLSPFGDGRIGVNTVFRTSTTSSMRDRNILEMYFSERNAPPVPLGPGYAWVVETHDTDDSYRYEEGGVRVCWRISGTP